MNAKIFRLVPAAVARHKSIRYTPISLLFFTNFISSDAQFKFDKMLVLDVASFTASIGHFVRQGDGEVVVNLLTRMFLLGIKPNDRTLCTLLSFSINLKDRKFGLQLHGISSKLGFSRTVFVGSATLDMYTKLGTSKETETAFADIDLPNVVSYTTMINWYFKTGDLINAFSVFRSIRNTNRVSYNAMIKGCSQLGMNELALNLYIEMMRLSFFPDEYTLPCTIMAAANVAALGLGRSLHCCAVKSRSFQSECVGNSLISFYAKCGRMEDGLKVFKKMKHRTIVSYNAVICGLAQNGKGKEAVEFYGEMKADKFAPNSVTLLGLLWGCNHAGLVDLGCSYFNEVKQENSEILTSEHYACMVDLFARGGRLKEAQGFLKGVPFEAGIGFWKALLGGCQNYCHAEMGEMVARKIMELNPEDVSSYVMLSNAHCAGQRWEEASKVRRAMKEKAMKRVIGSSWIELCGQIDVFVTNEILHSTAFDITGALSMFVRHSTTIGSDLFNFC